MTATTRPGVLVDIQWVAQHLDDPSLRLVEVGTGPDEYTREHLPGAVRLGVWEDMLDPDERVIADPVSFAQVMSRLGIAPDTTVVLYADSSLWGPGLAYWWLRAFGHTNTHVMDGGITTWRNEGRPTTRAIPTVAETAYKAPTFDSSIRATKGDVLSALERSDTVLLDARLPEEYDGKLFRPGQTPGPGQRAGHIPGARHVLWTETVANDGTYRPAAELQQLYASRGVTPDRAIIPYCTIGGRSGHTWFVLSQLLGYPHVRLYDASWAEWGQQPDAPIE